MKLFIVEDDKNIGISIKKIIEKQFREIDVFLFDNGTEAVENLKYGTCDILLTDIVMPGKNGFDVAESVLKANPQCKIIMLSAYSEKEYLKSAIDLHVEAFLEKPFEIDKLLRVIKKAFDSQLMDIEIKDLKKRKNNEIFLNLFTKPFSDEQKNRLKELTPDCLYLMNSEQRHTVVLFEFFENQELLTFDFHLELCKQLLSEYRHIVIPKTENMFIALISTQYDLNTQEVKEKIKSVIDNVFKHSESKTFNVYIGKSVSGISDVYNSYASAILLLQQGFVLGRGNIVISTDIDEIFSEEIEYDAFLRDFGNHLDEYDFDNCINCLDEFYKNIKENHKKVMTSKVKSSLTQMYYLLMNTFRKNEIFIETDYSVEKISNAESFDEAVTLLKEMLDYYIKFYRGKLNFITHAIISYISDNYADASLSLKTISDHTGYSIQHICNIFKKDMGITINNFILLKRIDKAKEFLLKTDYSCARIAESVGILDAGYFSKKFKAITGYNPGEFKDRGNL